MEARSRLSTRCAASSKPASARAASANTIQVLRLHEDFPARQVAAAVRDAVKRRLIGFDAVKHLLLARIERRPVHLDLSRYPHLPQLLRRRHAWSETTTPPLLAGGAGHG